ncbi:hypothetical protein BDF19DRAFT_445326 [Syncephalis fuscata]|nr:hypothetical protein BDF19DRAFT_445326 [Syncephalis fuscata]
MERDTSKSPTINQQNEFYTRVLYISKLVIGIVVSIYAGSLLALIIGTTVSIAARSAQEVADNDYSKELFRFIADCGYDAAVGSVIAAYTTPSMIISISIFITARRFQTKTNDQATIEAMESLEERWAEIAISGVMGKVVEVAAKAGTKACNEKAAKIIVKSGKPAEAISTITIEKTITVTSMVIEDTVGVLSDIYKHNTHKEKGKKISLGCRICNP